jgi:hypothetical protein
MKIDNLSTSPQKNQPTHSNSLCRHLSDRSGTHSGEPCGEQTRSETLQERMDNLPSLPLPVVGNRVEVLWKGELHAAEVVMCHRTGEYNVVYETDGTVRTFLPRDETRLVPLGASGDEVVADLGEGGRAGVAAVQKKKPVGPKQGRCVMEGCTKGVKVRGACIKHGAYGMCLIGDCTTMAVNKSQRCFKHGARGLCTVPGCATNAITRGLCIKHGAKDMCVHRGCTTNAQSRGLCWKHGGNNTAVCVHPGCTTKAQARELCFKHGGSTKGVCLHPGCTTRAAARGLCVKHGGDARPVCGHPGCTTKAKSRGLCVKHGGCTKTVCVHPGCTTKAKARGLCFKHGTKGVCPVGDCTCKVLIGGRCKKHTKACNSK